MPTYDNYVYTSAPGSDHHRQTSTLYAGPRKPSRPASKCYRPQLHRTPAFVLLLAAILSLIGLVEYGVRTLPGQKWSPARLTIGVTIPFRLRPRQAALSSALVSQSADAPKTPVSGSASAGASGGSSREPPVTPAGGSATGGVSGGSSVGLVGGASGSPVGGSASAGPTGSGGVGSVGSVGTPVTPVGGVPSAPPSGGVLPPASTPPPGSFLNTQKQTVSRLGTLSGAADMPRDSFLNTAIRTSIKKPDTPSYDPPTSTKPRDAFLDTGIKTIQKPTVVTNQPDTTHNLTPTPDKATAGFLDTAIRTITTEQADAVPTLVASENRPQVAPSESFFESDAKTTQKPTVQTKEPDTNVGPTTTYFKMTDGFLDTAIRTVTSEKAEERASPTASEVRAQAAPSESFLETAIKINSKSGAAVTPAPVQQTNSPDDKSSASGDGRASENSAGINVLETRISADFLNTIVETSTPTTTPNGAGSGSKQPSPRPTGAQTGSKSVGGSTGSNIKETGNGASTAGGWTVVPLVTTNSEGKTITVGTTLARASSGTAKGTGQSATVTGDNAMSSADTAASATAATSKLPVGLGISTISKAPKASESAKASAAGTAGGASRSGSRGGSSQGTRTARPKATGGSAKPTPGGATTPEDSETGGNGDGGEGGDGNGSTSAGAFSSSDPNRPDRGLKPMTGARYTAANYLPIILAILLRIAVGCTYATTKMMEPFFALSSTASAVSAHDSGVGSSSGGVGAPAAAFLHISYLATNDALDPVRALMHGHGTMLAAAAMYLAASIAPPFAAELLSVATFCFDNSPTTQVCGPEVRISYAVARVLQALLAAAAALLLVLWFLVERRARRDGRGAGGGVYQDPSAIATLAALLHHPAVLADLRRVHPAASKAEMLAALAHRRYALGWYVAPSGAERYGVIPAGDGAGAYMPLQNPAALPGAASGPGEGAVVEGGGHDGVEWQEKRQAELARLVKQRQRQAFRVARDVLLALVTAGTLALLCVYYRNSNPNLALERFMNSQKFGPRFVLAALGMGIYGQWKRIERELVVMEPYRLLAQGSVHERQRRLSNHHSKHRALLPPPPGPERTILATRTVTPLATLVSTAWHHFRRVRKTGSSCSSSSSSSGSIVIPVAAAICVLGELLIIALASIPYSPATLWHAYLASFYVAMGVLAAMLLAQAALALRQWRAPDPPLPRSPNTVGAVWSYLVGAAPLPGVKREGGGSSGGGGGGGGGIGGGIGGTSLLEDLADLGAASARRRDALVKGMGRAYSLEQCVGADGEVRWTIDYAE